MFSLFVSCVSSTEVEPLIILCWPGFLKNKHFCISLSIVGNSHHLTWVRQQLQEQHCPFLSVFVVFSCVRTMVWYGCLCLGFVTCAQMLRHAIMHRGCTDTVRVCTGRKIPCLTGSQTHIGIVPGFSVGRTTSWAIFVQLRVDLWFDGVIYGWLPSVRWSWFGKCVLWKGGEGGEGVCTLP